MATSSSPGLEPRTQRTRRFRCSERLWAVLSAGMLFVLLLPASAQQLASSSQQQPGPPPAQGTEIPFRVAARVERVNVDVSVTDARGHGVSGIAREQFHVFDNGTEQAITDFLPIDAPARVLLMVETSPAVYLLSREHLLAAYRMLDGLAPGDAVALAAYGDRLQGVMDFTTNKAAVGAALGQLQFSIGLARLDLFDSLLQALEALIAQAGAGPQGVPGKTAIVLLSTGLSDVQDPAVRSRLGGELQSSGIAVYTVALGGNLRSPKKDSGKGGIAAEAFEQANRDLRQIGESSGGRAYIPQTDKELADAYSEVAETLRHLYSIAFVPPAHDGKVHVITVQVRQGNNKDSWRILARPAYLAPSE